MDSNRIDELLKKYWEAETSLEEEEELKAFFSSEEVPEAYRETAAMFRYFSAASGGSVTDPGFDRRVLDKIESPPPVKKQAKVINWNFNNFLRVAAAVGGIVVAGYIIGDRFLENNSEDTFEDPKVAFEETKKALELLSDKWNTGREEAMKIKTINEAKDKVTSETKEVNN